VIVEVKVPVLAESVAEATLMDWHKNVGDTVTRGDSLIDIETDKVTLEVAAPNDGVLTEILKQTGNQVLSDEIIAKIETEISDTQVAPTKTDQAAQAESELATPVETAPEITTAPETTTTPQPEQQALPEIEPVPTTTESEPKLSPAVRNLLETHQLNPADIQTSSKDGRLTKEDVLKHIAQSKQPAPEPVKPQPPVAEIPSAVKPVVAETKPEPTTRPRGPPTAIPISKYP